MDTRADKRTCLIAGLLGVRKQERVIYAELYNERRTAVDQCVQCVVCHDTCAGVFRVTTYTCAGLWWARTCASVSVSYSGSDTAK